MWTILWYGTLSNLQVHTDRDVATQTLNYLNQVQHTNKILLFTQIRCFISDIDCFEYAQVTQVPRPRKHPEPLPNVISTLEASWIFFQMLRYGGVRLCFPKNRSRLQKRGRNMLFNPLRQALRRSTNVRSLTATRVFIDNQT